MQLTQNQQAAAQKDSRSMLVIDDVGKIYPNGTVAVQHANLHVGKENSYVLSVLPVAGNLPFSI